MSNHSNEPLDLDVALSRIRAQILPRTDARMEVEVVALEEALGRVLAEPVHTPLALPPFDNSAMDGYALAEAPEIDVSGRTFKVIGTSAAGHPFDGSVEPGECVRVFTGAATPAGCRRVVLQEDTDAHGDEMRITGSPDPRSNIRPTGHDVEAGTLLDPEGTCIDGFRIGRYAASGISRVPVFCRPRVGLFSTGDELCDLDVPPEALPAGAIYESNRHALMALMNDLPVEIEDFGNLRDDPEAIRDALASAAGRCDVIITSGGVSVGDHDHVKGIVEELGALDFWRLNLKPGKPLAFGNIGEAAFFGLPGNPVSTIITWLLIARPAVLTLCGATPRIPVRLTARLSSEVAHTPGRAEYQRGHFRGMEDGTIEVSITGHQASNRLSSFAEANCLVEVPKERADLKPGEPVQILPLSEL